MNILCIILLSLVVYFPSTATRNKYKKSTAKKTVTVSSETILQSKPANHQIKVIPSMAIIQHFQSISGNFERWELFYNLVQKTTNLPEEAQQFNSPHEEFFVASTAHSVGQMIKNKIAPNQKKCRLNIDFMGSQSAMGISFPNSRILPKELPEKEEDCPGQTDVTKRVVTFFVSLKKEQQHSTLLEISGNKLLPEPESNLQLLYAWQTWAQLTDSIKCHSVGAHHDSKIIMEFEDAHASLHFLAPEKLRSAHTQKSEECKTMWK